ncbi:MAG: thioesterase family protein [Desulfatiglandaceae bacterium]
MKELVTSRRVMWGDLDSLGIVFYPRYYEWIDACGHLFFEYIGLRLNDLWDNRGILFGLVETSCKYVSPGRYHDDMEIVTAAYELKRKTIGLRHVIRRAQSGELMVEGNETRVCLDCRDPKKLHTVAIPQDIAEILEKVI